MVRRISEQAWRRYAKRLYKINQQAYMEMLDYVVENSLGGLDAASTETIVEYAYALATKYGEASAALAAEMYDATAELAGIDLPAAMPAPTATYAEVAQAVVGTANTGNPKLVADSVSRLVKVAGVDTTMQNALRDGAEWAWIPVGETCAFCLALASRGWQTASKKAIRRGHARHIHANCNCTYAVRFDSETSVEGYDPEAYYDVYAAGEGDSADKINALRRRLYAENHDAINAQKRAAYRLREERRRQE